MKRREFVKRAGRASLALGVLGPRLPPFPGPPFEGAEADAPLSGPWRFRLDPADEGLVEGWFGARLPEEMSLPGTTDLARRGERTTLPSCGHLSRAWWYVGPAWYQREVEVPESWRGKRITLFLERCLWETRLWVDDRFVSAERSLCTPHEHEIGELPPGTHRLTLRVDNRMIVNVGDYQHSYTEQTQTRWNGVLGEVSLRATDPVWTERLHLHPDVEGRAVRVEARLRNATGRTVNGSATATVFRLEGGARRRVAGREVSVGALAAEGGLDFRVPLGADAVLWDEHSPVLHEAELELRVEPGGLADRATARFGLREVTALERRIRLNGRPVFLRGTVEDCIFPLAGHPPLDEDSWRRIFATARSYGLNHFRFHSWCPPEAAFRAADEAGVLLHVEAPLWDQQRQLVKCDEPVQREPWTRPAPFGRDPEAVRFIESEVQRILDAYGNHPSFAMLCVGNEVAGDYGELERIIRRAAASDGRHLYTCSTARKLTAADEFYVTHRTPAGRVRGLQGEGTDWDYRVARDALPIPVVSHEIGQWVTHPDYAELPKYTGALVPRNLERLRDRLAASGILELAREFQLASGTFAWQLYKTEIEAALRTPLAGFQLLQLTDYPGQGEAMVGLLDAFWESKGLVAPARFRRFCDETVALARFPRWVWRSGETFTAAAEVHHAGGGTLRGLRAEWSLVDDAGARVGGGSLPAVDAAPGGVTRLGRISLPLAADAARRLRLSLRLDGGRVENDWDLWVFPPAPEPPLPGDATVTDRPGDALDALRAGRRVLLLVPPGATGPALVPTRFLPVFWSAFMFTEQAGGLGILCDPAHPALAGFPTERHADWQWRALTENGGALRLQGEAARLRPVVRTIDDFHWGRSLGALLEARVGPGRLLVCGLNLGSAASDPAAAALRASLLRYLASDAFDPGEGLTVEFAREWLRWEPARA